MNVLFFKVKQDHRKIIQTNSIGKKSAIKLLKETKDAGLAETQKI